MRGINFDTVTLMYLYSIFRENLYKGPNILHCGRIHTELVSSLGPLDLVLNTSAHHRVHHGANRFCLDCNYAGVLIIWDRFRYTKSCC